MITLEEFRANLNRASRYARPDISDPNVRRNLPPNRNPYWALLAINRHIGYDKKRIDQAFWVARWKTKNGDFRQTRLGEADDYPADTDGAELDFQQAIDAAGELFSRPEISSASAEAKPLRSELSLIYSPVGEIYTVGHAIEEYLEWKELANARSHVQVIYSLANHHIMLRIGTMAAGELGARDARKLVQDIIECPPRTKPGQGRVSILSMDVDTLRRRRKTANTVIGILRESLRLAWEDKKIDSDRCWRVLRTTRLPYRPRSQHLTDEEVKALCNASTPELRRLILGALYTGCRVGELLRVTARDVAREGYGISILPGKTQTGRLVFLSDEGMAFFLSLAEACSPEQILFVRDDGRFWTSSTYRVAMRKAVDEAGLDRQYCFHALRHTYASALVRRGAKLHTIADQLGHANTIHVMKTYGHLAPKTRADEIRKLVPSLDEISAQAAQERSYDLEKLRLRLGGPPAD